jgi:hypothetical protein
VIGLKRAVEDAWKARGIDRVTGQSVYRDASVYIGIPNARREFVFQPVLDIGGDGKTGRDGLDIFIQSTLATSVRVMVLTFVVNSVYSDGTPPAGECPRSRGVLIILVDALTIVRTNGPHVDLYIDPEAKVGVRLRGIRLRGIVAGFSIRGILTHHRREEDV